MRTRINLTDKPLSPFPGNNFLKNKTALVTGGAKRLGRAITLALSAQGADLIIHYNSSEKDAEKLVCLIKERGGNACAIKADLEDSVQAEELIENACAKSLSPVAILINNASIFPESSFEDMTPMDFLQNMQVNALSPFLITRQFAAAEEAEAVINILDSRIVQHENLLDARIESKDKSHLAYQESKRTLFSLTRSMALELAPQIRVNGVAPGLILPPEDRDESYLAKYGLRNPLRKQCACSHVTETILFLLQSDFITGQVVFVDGGRNLKG